MDHNTVRVVNGRRDIEVRYFFNGKPYLFTREASTFVTVRKLASTRRSERRLASETSQRNVKHVTPLLALSVDQPTNHESETTPGRSIRASINATVPFRTLIPGNGKARVEKKGERQGRKGITRRACVQEEERGEEIGLSRSNIDTPAINTIFVGRYKRRIIGRARTYQ